MSTVENTTQVSGTEAVIAGLEEVIAFLREHPETSVRRTFVVGGSKYGGGGPLGREELETFAANLSASGHTPTEKADDYGVSIHSEFGPVTLSLEASYAKLGATVPARPRYEPILKDGGGL